MSWTFDSASGVYRNHALSSKIRLSAIANSHFMRFATPEPGYGKGKGESVTLTFIDELPTTGTVNELDRLPSHRPDITTRTDHGQGTRHQNPDDAVRRKPDPLRPDQPVPNAASGPHEAAHGRRLRPRRSSRTPHQSHRDLGGWGDVRHGRYCQHLGDQQPQHRAPGRNLRLHARDAEDADGERADTSASSRTKAAARDQIGQHLPGLAEPISLGWRQDLPERHDRRQRGRLHCCTRPTTTTALGQQHRDLERDGRGGVLRRGRAWASFQRGRPGTAEVAAVPEDLGRFFEIGWVGTVEPFVTWNAAASTARAVHWASS